MAEKLEHNSNLEVNLFEKLSKNYENIQLIRDIIKRSKNDLSFSNSKLSQHLWNKNEKAKNNYLILWFKKRPIETASYKSTAELYRDIQLAIIKRIAIEIGKIENPTILKESFFNKVKLTHDKQLLHCFKEFITNDLKDILSNIILFSRDSTEFDISASNAITILNYTSHFISMKDFHGIRIPEADLSYCSFINVNFENSFLKGANLSHAFFYSSNLENCDLEDVFFEQRSPILLENALYKSELTISSSGKYIAYIQSSKKWKMLDIVVIRNILSQEIVTNIRVESMYSYVIDFSTDEKYFAIGSDMNLKLIDLDNRQAGISMVKDYEKLEALKFSFDGNNIALASSNNVYLWYFKAVRRLVNVANEASPIKKLICPKLSSYMIIITEVRIKFYDLFEKNCTRAISGNFKNVKSIEFSSQEKYFILFNDVVLQIIRIEDFEIIFNKKINAPIFISISSCGQFLSLSDLRRSKIFNLDSQIFVNEIKCYEKKPKRILFSPCGKFYLIANNDNCIKQFNFDQIESHKYEKKAHSISFSSHQKKHYLAIARSQDSSIVLDLENNTQVSDYLDFNFSPQILFNYRKTFLRFWNLRTGDEKHYRFSGNINGVGVSPCGKYSAIAFGGQIVEFKDLELDKTLITWNSRFDDIHISASPCGNYFAIGVSNKIINRNYPLPNKILIWETKTWKREFELPIKDDAIGALACSPYGKYLAFGQNEIVKLWDIKEGKELFCLFGHKAKVSSAAFSFSGDYLASGSDDRSIILWEIDENSQVIKIGQVLAHISKVSSIIFSQCNKYFISLGWNYEILVWKIKDKEIVLKWRNKKCEETIFFNTSFSNSKLSQENQNFVEYEVKLNN